MQMKGDFVIHPRKWAGESSVISARLPNAIINQLDGIVRQTGRSRNELILLCIEYALNDLVCVEEALIK